MNQQTLAEISMVLYLVQGLVGVIDRISSLGDRLSWSTTLDLHSSKGQIVLFTFLLENSLTFLLFSFLSLEVANIGEVLPSCKASASRRWMCDCDPLSLDISCVVRQVLLHVFVWSAFLLTFCVLLYGDRPYKCARSSCTESVEAHCIQLPIHVPFSKLINELTYLEEEFTTP